MPVGMQRRPIVDDLHVWAVERAGPDSALIVDASPSAGSGTPRPRPRAGYKNTRAHCSLPSPTYFSLWQGVVDHPTLFRPCKPTGPQPASLLTTSSRALSEASLSLQMGMRGPAGGICNALIPPTSYGCAESFALCVFMARLIPDFTGAAAA